MRIQDELGDSIAWGMGVAGVSHPLPRQAVQAAGHKAYDDGTNLLEQLIAGI